MEMQTEQQAGQRRAWDGELRTKAGEGEGPGQYLEESTSLQPPWAVGSLPLQIFPEEFCHSLAAGDGRLTPRCLRESVNLKDPGVTCQVPLPRMTALGTTPHSCSAK